MQQSETCSFIVSESHYLFFPGEEKEIAENGVLKENAVLYLT